ncbi:DUF5365 family protein [Aquibacillus kalidii]|uniref:DUF5365 family protein n=1 Tax=Aquibacillus kalidii TaxID=2762597 RepID=UPI0016476898|nr:DUF5365 family protein [Aquibacillus kalidii]
MKVVTASTPEQQYYVKELIEKLYDSIFPYFFTKEYIQELKRFNLMHVPNLEDLDLTEIMEVTAAVQTITTILEQSVQTTDNLSGYEQAFNKNATILSKYEIDFPFQLNDFCGNIKGNTPQNTFTI